MPVVKLPEVVKSTADSDENHIDVDENNENIVQGNKGLVLDRSYVLKGSQAILTYMQSEKYLNQLRPSSKPDLLASDKEPQKIMINFSLWTALSGKNRYFPVRMKELPFRVTPRGMHKKVCLIVPNVAGKTAEETTTFFRTIAEKVNSDFAYEAITFQELKTKIETFADKRKVLKDFDLFIADASLRDMILQKLGVVFKRAKKLPIVAKLSRPAELRKILNGTHFFMHNNATGFSYAIGHSAMKAEELCENVIVSLNKLVNKIENGWRNIKTVGLIGHKTAFIPIYDSADVSSLESLKDIYEMFSSKQMAAAKALRGEENAQEVAKHKEIVKQVEQNKQVTKKKFSKISELKLKMALGTKNKKAVLKSKLEAKKQPENEDLVKKILQEGDNNKKPEKFEQNQKKGVSDSTEQLKEKEKGNRPKIASENDSNSEIAQKQSSIRSTSDVALKKKLDRKLKRQLQESTTDSAESLTGFDKYSMTSPPPKKKKNINGSPKLTGLEKHLFEGSPPKNVKNRHTSTGLTGREKFMFSSEGGTSQKFAKKENREELSDVEIPDDFFGSDEDAAEEARDKVDVKKVPKTPARKTVAKKTRNASVDNADDIQTPLRRSGRIHSSKA
ncbi:uncharacterized protein LOC134853287 [Symsagittifera roscoffensis]|uniref:uncharacterized protein LOC134853287 n=1 Tax=Symsagittifera roscoffensis TaxID=84072 RepID=UPI00307C3200